MISRRKVMSDGARLVGAVAASAAASARATAAMPPVRRIPYGSSASRVPLAKDLDYRHALETYCQQLTPEGGLFWFDLRPSRDQFNFDFADSVLAFAEANSMTMRGHTLVWYGAMPDWTKQIGSAAEAERELVNHITRVVSRYRGKIKTWHVVNEPIDEPKGKVAGLRPSVWLQYLGEKYIDMAFRLAHQADPAAELLLNEYDIECVDDISPPRRQALLQLVHNLLDRGVPLHGVGLQGHIRGSHEIDGTGLHAFVSEIRSLGLSVHVTELDVIDNELPAPAVARDAIVAARAYDFLNAIFAGARPAVIATWGITDRYTWMPMWYKRTDGLRNRPLPLDEDYRPKPLWSVIDYFCRQTA
jgi:endo-1,4-beta-xylanase